ncbi:MAG TPA: YdeI/OmpD-associated family protein [Flavobacterium sp.]|uniref:YdeI/OmpD-associated family protein n=1 Tax=Flavobacterium sp. TaxID=239 RepID=UPI002C28A58B|nr:YdeI/OmpD-associated family protein [Flavobacterium sp.]HNP32393.1 YdeI/OmpD-associated family protein [Flavobacterium sp.]
MHKIKAQLEIIGINPYILLPEEVLNVIFEQAGKNKGPIPIKGRLNNKPYIQTLVRYRGFWRLYINTTMLKNSPKRIGETIEITVEFDPEKRTIQQYAKLKTALENNKEAKATFDSLSPSRQNEIVRYISNLKSEDSIDRNVSKAIDFLLGNERFAGRDKP